MDRVERNVSAIAFEGDVNDYEVVDVVKIFAKTCIGNLFVYVAEDKIACSPNAYLTRDMTRKRELTIIPADLDLCEISYQSVHGIDDLLLSFRRCRYRYALHN